MNFGGKSWNLLHSYIANQHQFLGHYFEQGQPGAMISRQIILIKNGLIYIDELIGTLSFALLICFDELEKKVAKLLLGVKEIVKAGVTFCLVKCRIGLRGLILRIFPIVFPRNSSLLECSIVLYGACMVWCH